MHPATRRQAAGAALGGLAVLLAALFLSPDRLLGELAAMRSRPLLFGAALLAAYLLRPAVAWPISALSIVVGFVYGPVGIPVGLAGAVLTCLPPYLLARRAGAGAGALGRLGDSGARLFGAAGGFRGIVSARLAPLPADAVSYAAGLSGVRPLPYAAGTLLGETPWVTAAVLAGASMGRLTVGGAGAATVPLAVGGAALAALVLAGPAYRYLRDDAGQ